MSDGTEASLRPMSGSDLFDVSAVRRLLPVARIAAGWGTLLAIVFFALSALSLQTDDVAETARVRDAFDSQIVRADGAWLGGNVVIGAHQWNDCLVLNQAVNRQAPTTQLIVSPRYTGPLLPTLDPCPYANAFAHGRPISAQPAFYHRYLHGHTVLARLLLAKLSVNSIRWLYSGLITTVLMLGIAQVIVTLAEGKRLQESVVWLISLFAFARFFGLEMIGQSLAHGPSDLVLIGFVLFLTRCSATGGLSPRKVPMVAAIFGALTIIFEFLTGGIPLGLALLVGGLPFALPPLRASNGETVGRIVAEAVLAFSVSIAVIVAIKAILVGVLFGPEELGPIIRQLSYRIGLPAPAIGGEQDNGIAALIANVLGNLGGLAAGQGIMAALLLLISLCAGGWATRRLVSLGDDVIRPRAVALASSNLAIIGWLVLFMHHTAQHARFMDRILVWTIASGLSLFALAVMNGLTVADRPRSASRN